MFVYNATYAKEEFWGFEFTGYEGRVANFINGGNSRLDSFEIDGNYTRGDFNFNLQATIGRQVNGAFNGGDSQWFGVSALVAQRLTPQFTLAGRADYLYNQKNGGGTFAIVPSYDSSGASLGSDFINGFGPGDANASDYDQNKGANRYALTVAGTYRLTPNVAFRAEFRHDMATRPVFYYFSDNNYRKSNDLIGLQGIINF